MSNIGKEFVVYFLSGIFVFFLSAVAMAQHHHDQGGGSTTAPKKAAPHDLGKRPVQSVTEEGLKIDFEVMSIEAHMAMPGLKGHSQHGAAAHSQSHAIMVMNQDTASKEIISDAKVMFSVSSPSGAEESGKLEWSGDHYAGGFSPKAKGTYQVRLKITSGGMEREAKFLYEAKK